MEQFDSNLRRRYRKRVSRALQLVASVSHHDQNTLERQNPVPYFVQYFGYNGTLINTKKFVKNMDGHTY